MSEKNNIAKWDMFELCFTPNEHEFNIAKNPFDVIIKSVFQSEGRSITAYGFYAGNKVYKIRFMPDKQGEWTYCVDSELASVNGHTGKFICTEPQENIHGVARVKGQHFAYDDGTPLYPIGTTCYAWIHQTEDLRRQTIESLKLTRFKKIRMCVFPKHYDFNNNEPELYPFEGNPEVGFDYSKPNFIFYDHLESCLSELSQIGIEADIILFHTYDRWGFSGMDDECNHRYLKYITARLCSFSNIWWSLANEYDLLRHIDEIAWERFAETIMKIDYAKHLISIHNCNGFYDHSKLWLSHASIQHQSINNEYTNEWIDKYKKPVILDEFGYEGDINWGWGNLTAEELTRRAWECFVRGGYPGHGETYVSSDDVLWWSKGGILKGESPARFDFLLKICEEMGGISFLPERKYWDIPFGGIEGKAYITYFGLSRPRFRDFSKNLPEGNYKVEIVDTWHMTIDEYAILPQSKLYVELPARPYIAVKFTLMSYTDCF